MSQTSREKSQSIILIVNLFLLFFLSVCVSVSVTEFSEVLPPFFPPHLFICKTLGGG